ncbi:TPR repeat protein [Filimonas zeae]|nr:TPR repeat protein [Filimonas zeae]
MEEGKVAAADYTTAIEWYTKAADKGYKEAYDKLYSI